MNNFDIFDSISPIDCRYFDPEVAKYLSEKGFISYKLSVELALVKVLAKHGICTNKAVNEVTSAIEKITAQEILDEEKTVKHDIRALVNCIQKRVSDETKPFVHLTATSYDIVDNANAKRYKDVIEKVMIPNLVELEKTLANLAIKEANTVQVGRTHGQHAIPTTFGFYISGYVSRLGHSIENLKKLSENLIGKFSGAVGSYNASSLFFEDPEKFEAEVLSEIGLKSSEHSTQIMHPEPLTRLFSEVIIISSILANLSDDMRHLQRTEINEIGEIFEDKQVGSSTMPQKRNPINFENSKSIWKIVMPRLMTVYMDEISEHQRDLTNSASARTYSEIIAYVIQTIKRLSRTMKKVTLDHLNLEKNLSMQKDLVLAEPLYIILASLGHPDAHEAVRKVTLRAQKENKTLSQIILSDSNMQKYIQRMTPYQRKILSNPKLYTGIASKKALKIAKSWKDKLKLK